MTIVKALEMYGRESGVQIEVNDEDTPSIRDRVRLIYCYHLSTQGTGLYPVHPLPQC
jgi:hypothetical protein